MSFYILELLLDQDLTRRDYYIYTNQEKIRDKLRSYLTTGSGCYEAVWYGAEINIYVFEEYLPKCKIDMHNYIIFELDEYPQIYFDADNQTIAIRQDETVITKDDAEFDEYFCVKVCNNEENINVQIDLSSLPPLMGRLLERQEIFTTPIFPNIKLHYGHNDLEFGNDMSESESNMSIESDEYSSDISFEDDIYEN